MPFALLGVAGVLRAGYLGVMELPASDPWRHMAVVRNLRAGLGLTLYDGQPFIWYAPGWHHLLAAMPSALPLASLAACFSALSVLPLYAIARGLDREGRAVGAVAALLFAMCAPVVAFSCHFGPEALALCLSLCGVALAGRSGRSVVWLLAGLLFGCALTMRINFVFLGLLFLVFLRRPAQAFAVVAGAALPVALLWLRNRACIEQYPFVFTWDGMASKSSEYNAVSSLLLVSHPDVSAALRELHSRMLPDPEWIRGVDGIAWGPLLFMLSGAGCVLLSGNLGVLLAGSATMAYLLLFDTTHSSNFFRLYLPIFPVFSIAVALVCVRLWRGATRLRRAAAVVLVAGSVAAGAEYLIPYDVPPVEVVTPPTGLLQEAGYVVNSGFYQPESLIYRYPEKRFIGLPRDPRYLEAFRRAYPQYEYVLWHHSFSVQQAMFQALIASGAKTLRVGRNEAGHRYTVLRMPPLR